VKALSIKHPWAWLIVAGRKTVETREWSPGYPGQREARHLVGQRIAVHASQAVDRSAIRALAEYGVDLGRAEYRPGIVGLVRLVGVRPMRAGDVVAAVDLRMPESGRDRLRHLYDVSGLTALLVTDAVRFSEPFPCAGRLGFWDVPADVLARMED
jgi:hypothetical protein